MTIQAQLKGFVEGLPESAGRPFSHVPFVLRFGPAYRRMQAAISFHEVSELGTLDKNSFEQLHSILGFVTENVPFYREFYRSKGFSFEDFRSLGDWGSVPVVTKSDLQNVPPKDRCASGAKGMPVNTGGTSGQPLEFLLDNQAFAREWAHVHYIWKAHGYRPQHVKVTFRGKHFDKTQPLRYNAVHNEYVANANCPMSQIVDAVLALPRGMVIRWLHGYPSLVSEFAHALSERLPAVQADVRSRLFGVLLGSEYPAPVYRSVIEQVLSTNVVSWYGHSEMAVLARETSRGVYESLPTYGYAEAVPTGNGNEHRLVCTSFYNRAHPFIRYDTGDLIEPVSMHGGSLAFRIREGRVGDFIYDRSGHKHALTAIVFGRHHGAFELLQHLQVRDEGQGRITLVLTPRDPRVKPETLKQGFDLDDLDIDLKLELVDEPIRTQAGKIRLKITE